jgi:hypothetical protein
MLNPINLDALKTYSAQLEKAITARNGTSGEHSQMLLNTANLGVEIAFVAASAVLSVALDVRAIRASLAPRSHRLTGLSNKSEPLS